LDFSEEQGFTESNLMEADHVGKNSFLQANCSSDFQESTLFAEFEML
jgi:hypothetical protein